MNIKFSQYSYVTKINPAFTSVNNSARYGVLATMLLEFPTYFTKRRRHKDLLQDQKYVYILVNKQVNKSYRHQSPAIPLLSTLKQTFATPYSERRGCTVAGHWKPTHIRLLCAFRDSSIQWLRNGFKIPGGCGKVFLFYNVQSACRHTYFSINHKDRNKKVTNSTKTRPSTYIMWE